MHFKSLWITVSAKYINEIHYYTKVSYSTVNTFDILSFLTRYIYKNRFSLPIFQLSRCNFTHSLIRDQMMVNIKTAPDKMKQLTDLAVKPQYC